MPRNLASKDRDSYRPVIVSIAYNRLTHDWGFGGRTRIMSKKLEARPFTFRFIDVRSGVLLELTNTTDQELKAVEILSVFLKDEGEIDPPQAHIRFDVVKCIQP